MYRAVDASTSGLLPRPTPHGLEAQYARDNSPTSSIYGGDDAYHNNGVGPNSMMGGTGGSAAISEKVCYHEDSFLTIVTDLRILDSSPCPPIQSNGVQRSLQDKRSQTITCIIL